MSEHLSHHHRQTLSHLFDHQQAGNIHWREVESLLDHLGDVEHEHNGKVKVTLAGQTLVVHPPKHGELDRQQVVDVRHLLSEAGYTPEA